VFNLAEYNPIKIGNGINITRIDPYSDEDFNVLSTMVNEIDGIQTVKNYILNGTNTLLPLYLN
jgi:hypothetical protein